MSNNIEVENVAKRSQEHNKCIEAFFSLMKEKPEFGADDFYEKAREAEIDPTVLARAAGKLFALFKRSGYLVKTGRFATSKRGNRAPLPVYKSTLYKGN